MSQKKKEYFSENLSNYLFIQSGLAKKQYLILIWIQ